MKISRTALALLLLAWPAMLRSQWAFYSDTGRPRVMLEAAGGGWLIASERNIIKLSETGALVWGQHFGVSAGKAWTTPDGSILIAADAAGHGSGATLFKLSADGSGIWAKGYLPEGDFIAALSPTADGGAVMAGKLASDLLVLKCSSDGEIVWQRSYGVSTEEEAATALTVTSDGGILVLGSAVTSGPEPLLTTKLWVLKLAPSGEIEWQKYIGGDGADLGESVVQTDDGGFLVAGHSSSFDANSRDLFWLMKLSPNGDILRQWTLDYEFSGQGWISLRPAADGSFFGTIRSNAPGTIGRAVLVSVGQDGALLQERTYTVTNLGLIETAAVPAADGGYLLAMSGLLSSSGGSELDAHVIKIQASGGVGWHKVYGSRYAPDSLSLLGQAPSGYVMAGTTGSWGGLQDALWAMRIASDGSINPDCFFIDTGGGVTVEEPSGLREVNANVVETSAVSRNTSLIAAAVDVSLARWGESPLHALGKDLCTLKISSETGGTTGPAPGSHTYKTGAGVRLSADPKAGCTFLEWSGNISTRQQSPLIIMDGDKTVWASFHDSWDDIAEELGCYIATAAYGDPSHPDVEVLRRFRDRYLMRSRIGRDLVGLYYRYSPALARFVAKRPQLRAISRAVLSRIAAICSWLL